MRVPGRWRLTRPPPKSPCPTRATSGRRHRPSRPGGRLRRHRREGGTRRRAGQQRRLPARGPDRDYDPEARGARSIDVHLFGMFHCTALAIPRMKAGGGGAIVSVASTAAIVGLPGRGPYTAAKGAITAWTRSLAVEHGAGGHPGQRGRAGPGADARWCSRAWTTARSPRTSCSPRSPCGVWPRPEEIAGRSGSSPATRRPTSPGETIVVDGGWTIQGMRDRPPGWASSGVAQGGQRGRRPARQIGGRTIGRDDRPHRRSTPRPGPSGGQTQPSTLLDGLGDQLVLHG